MALESNGSRSDVAVGQDRLRPASQREIGRRNREGGGGEDGERQERGSARDSCGGGRGRRVESEGVVGSEESAKWRISKMEKEKLVLTSGHNQQLCRLQAELTRLRSSVERGEAQRAELQYKLTLSQRDGERAAELRRDNHTLTDRTSELQQTAHELQKALDITQHVRQEDHHALQQRDRLIQTFSSDNQQLHQLLQDQNEALEEVERRITEVQKEREKEAEVNRRQTDELILLTEKSRREKELHARDLEAALALQRSSQQEAQRSLELLQAQFIEVERAYSLERERSVCTEHALERLQKEFEQCKSDLSVAVETEMKTTSDLVERLEKEKKLHFDTHSLLEQAEKRLADSDEIFVKCLNNMRKTLQQHSSTGCRPSAKDDGKQSPSAEVLQLLKTTLSSFQVREREAEKQVQDLLLASDKLNEENQALRQQLSDQSAQIKLSVQLQEEVTRLRQESSDWSTLSRGLQVELEREREEMTADIQRITDQHNNESQAYLSFLYCVYQRLLAGCVLLNEPQSVLGNFTWKELCDVINEQVDQLTSDLQTANNKVACLQSVCEKKSVCVQELQRSQECVLSRLEESLRRKEEAWSSRHTHTVTQLQKELQLFRSQCESLHDRISSLTSDLSRLWSLLSHSRRESASFLSACALLAGTAAHAHQRLQTLCELKTLLSRRLADREELEEEVRRLAGALGGEEEEERGRRRSRGVRRWRKTMCVVLAVMRLRAVAKTTAVLFRLERVGGGPAICVIGDVAMVTKKGQDVGGKDDDDDDDDDAGDEGREGACARWLRSKRLSSSIMSCMADLQEVLAHTGSSPPDVMSAARTGLSRLLDHLLNQSDSPSCVEKDMLTLSRLTPWQPNKALVLSLQQHFLLFSQRLHSAEVERRSLRLEVSNLKRAGRTEKDETSRAVPQQRFHGVCSQMHTLQLQVNTHTGEQADNQHTLSQTAESLSEARQQLSQRERSLRILGKHLSGIQRKTKQLEERLQQAEDELRDADRRRNHLVTYMKAAERSYKELRQGLVQSCHSLSDQPRPLPLPREHLEISGAESIMGAPELAVCQSLLSSVSQLYQMCSRRIEWLQQEVSSHRSQVTALVSEQDVCLHDDPALITVAPFPPITDVYAPPATDLSKESAIQF